MGGKQNVRQSSQQEKAKPSAAKPNASGQAGGLRPLLLSGLVAAVGVAVLLVRGASDGGSDQTHKDPVATPPPAAPPVQFEGPLEAGPELLEELKAHYGCALRCSALGEADRKAVEGLWAQAGCTKQADHPICASSVEQLCAGACGGGRQDMSKWLPGAFGPSARKELSAEELAELDAAYAGFQACARRCSSEGVAVQASAPGAAERALETLKRCGVVQLVGAYDLELLDTFQAAFDSVKANESLHKKLLDQKQLHNGRFQVYLPFTEDFKARRALGVGDLVHAVLAGYFGGEDAGGFGIDHVSVLSSSSGSLNQSLHPDVPYFKEMSVSVHTALQDITAEMGPTYFCPCTGESLHRSTWSTSAAIKMLMLKKTRCVGSSFAPAVAARGTVTIYDGAMFHKGLENRSPRERPVLKLEVGAKGIPARRNYIQMAPKAAKRATSRFRKAMGPPRMGDAA